MGRKTLLNSKQSYRIKSNQITLKLIFNLIFHYLQTGKIKNLEIEIESSIKQKIVQTREIIENIKESVYGVNTGFGKLYDKKIEKEDMEKLQMNLIYSHSAGYGKPVNKFIVFLTILIRLNQLLQGHSGISLELIEQIIKLLKNKDLPKVPKFTSVGASGDLIPLSHIFLKIIENYKPKAKESLSFINGTSYSLANFIIGLFSIKEVLNFSNFVLILSAKANKVNFEHFTLSLKKTKKNKYFIKVLQDLNKIISDLDLKVNNPMLQAPYCYRCYPQIVESLYGVFDLAYLFAKSELNSSTDNPLLINNKFISAGNFHGNTISAFSDHLKTHVFQLANLSFQRMNHLLHPKFLTLNEGLNSGFMISQYLASHLLAELKIISQRLSVENFPVSLNQEDFVSYSENNSKLLLKSIYICSLILSIELLLALQKVKLYENLNLAKLRKYLKKFLIKTDVLDILPIKNDEEFRKFSSIEGLQNKIFLNHKLIRFLENLVEDL